MHTSPYSSSLLVFAAALGLSGCEGRLIEHREHGAATYYAAVDSSAPGPLRATLHARIDDHTRFPYTSTATDTWDILEAAHRHPSDPNLVVDVYRNAAFVIGADRGRGYNREHTWPSSYGYPQETASNLPYTDAHALFLAAAADNSARNNKIYDFCSPACEERPTHFTDGRGGGPAGRFPGTSNWTDGAGATGAWETWVGRRGDVARAIFYLDARYEGGTHGVSGAAEPDLVLTDDRALIASANTGHNEPVGYMGLRSVLLRWHVEDPVDAREQARNDVIAGFQGNRNPFVDHPEWVACLFDGICGDTLPPPAPAGLVAAAVDGRVDLDWADSAEPELLGYFVARATGAAGPFSRLYPALLDSSDYSDDTAINDVTYWYAVTAVDQAGNLSAPSVAVRATPSATGGVGAVFINELHYDNAGADQGEGVEVAGPAGTDLSGWSLVGYNGSNGTTYRTVNLSGTLPDEGGCMGTLSFAFPGMQNGAPDGLALVDDHGAVHEFLSYEGTLVASNGPAVTSTSADIGVFESPSLPPGLSVQRAGTGRLGGDFSWRVPSPASPGVINDGQVFDGCGAACSGDADCGDGLFCNGAEACAAGACRAGVPPIVDDGIPCTVDRCDEAADAVLHLPEHSRCDDGQYCNGAEVCDVNQGCAASPAPCLGRHCDEAGDACVDCLDDTHCDDGRFCNGPETCAAGACLAGAAPVIDDGVACTVDTCDEVAGAVSHSSDDARCSDGLFCTGEEFCHPTQGCLTSPTPCPGQFCDEVQGVCAGCLEDAHCDDGRFCNGAEVCVAGACTGGAPVDCAGLDGACQRGVCDERLDACTPDPTPARRPCDDNDACTGDDRCDGAGQCAGVPLCSGGPLLSTLRVRSGPGWTALALPWRYASPVVVCTPVYPASRRPVVVRMRNLTSTGFELATVRADSNAAAVAGLWVHCVAVEEGVYHLGEHGARMEAVRYVSSETGQPGHWQGSLHSYQNPYSNPVVIGQVMSAHDLGWSTFYSRGPRTKDAPDAWTLVTGKHIGGAPNRTHAAEEIGFIVVEAGLAHVTGRNLVAGVTDAVPGRAHRPAHRRLAVSMAAGMPTAVASQAGIADAPGGWAVLRSKPRPGVVDLGVDRPDHEGAARRAPERAGYLVIH